MFEYQREVSKKPSIEQNNQKIWLVNSRLTLVWLERMGKIEKAFFPKALETYVIIIGKPHMKIGIQKSVIMSDGDIAVIMPTDIRLIKNEFNIPAIFWVISDRNRVGVNEKSNKIEKL